MSQYADHATESSRFGSHLRSQEAGFALAGRCRPAAGFRPASRTVQSGCFALRRENRPPFVFFQSLPWDRVYRGTGCRPRIAQVVPIPLTPSVCPRGLGGEPWDFDARRGDTVLGTCSSWRGHQVGDCPLCRASCDSTATTMKRAPLTPEAIANDGPNERRRIAAGAAKACGARRPHLVACGAVIALQDVSRRIRESLFICATSTVPG